MDAEDILYLLYTSGTTGKPKGITHTTGGYLTQVAATHRMIFDIHDDDVFWCAADCGWVTGHSYIVYGPLANHTTGIMYEGAPDWPDKDRLVVDRGDVPGDDPLHGAHRDPRVHAMGDRVPGEARPLLDPAPRVGGRADQPGGMGLVLEGHRRRTRPVVDTWWQTETGAILITPLPGVTKLKPGFRDDPVPGDPGRRRR